MKKEDIKVGDAFLIKELADGAIMTVTITDIIKDVIFYIVCYDENVKYLNMLDYQFTKQINSRFCEVTKL